MTVLSAMTEPPQQWPEQHQRSAVHTTVQASSSTTNGYTTYKPVKLLYFYNFLQLPRSRWLFPSAMIELQQQWTEPQMFHCSPSMLGNILDMCISIISTPSPLHKRWLAIFFFFYFSFIFILFLFYFYFFLFFFFFKKKHKHKQTNKQTKGSSQGGRLACIVSVGRWYGKEVEIN